MRVDGIELVAERPGSLRRAPITSLREAAAVAGIELDPSDGDRFDVPPPGPLDERLPVTADAADALAAWYALADDVLRIFAGELAADDDASPPRLWPEHFDLAIDAGSEAAGQRGSWGFSPGDRAFDEPYAYVSLPAAVVPAGDPFWNATTFAGALLSHAALRASGDARAAALGFLRGARRRLASAPRGPG